MKLWRSVGLGFAARSGGVSRFEFPLLASKLQHPPSLPVDFSSASLPESFLVPLLNIYNAQYLMRLATGPPAMKDREAVYSANQRPPSSTTLQFFTVVPDTGSDDFWLPSVECKAQTNWRCPPDPPSFAELPFLKRTLYNASRSPSARQRNDGRRISYGDGTTVKTIKVLDDVSLTGWSSVNSSDHLLTLPSVGIERAVDFSSPTTTLIADGILGLSATKPDTLLSVLLKTHPDLTPMISFYLSHFEDQMRRFELKDLFVSDDRHSALIIGRPRWDLFAKGKTRNWTKAPASASASKFRWLADLHRLGLSGTGFELDLTREPQWSSGAATLIDSGNSLLTLHPTIWDAVAEQLIHNVAECSLRDGGTNQRYVACPCAAPWASRLLNFLRGTSWLPSIRMQFLKANTTGELFDVCIDAAELLLKDSDDGSMCRFGIQVGPKQMPVPVVAGVLFMRSVYVTFDLKKEALAFARSQNSVLLDDAICPVERISPSAQCTNFAIRSMILLGPLLALGVMLACAPSRESQEEEVEEKEPLLAVTTSPGSCSSLSSPMITPKVIVRSELV